MEESPTIKKTRAPRTPPNKEQETETKASESDTTRNVMSSITQNASTWDEQMPTLVNVVLDESEQKGTQSHQESEKIPLRCLICYSFLDTHDGKISKSLVTGKDMYKIFSLTVKQCYVLEETNFTLPLCPGCTDLVGNAQELTIKMEELEKSLEELRQQLRNKIVSSFDGHCNPTTVEEGETASLEKNMMMHVETVRQDVLMSIKRQLKKRSGPGRPKRSDQSKSTTIAGAGVGSENQPKIVKLESSPDPYVLLQSLPDDKPKPSKAKADKPAPVPEEPVTMSKAGRVIKRPKRLMMIPAPSKSATPLAPVIKDEETKIQEIQQKNEDNDQEQDLFDENTPDPDWSPVCEDEENEEDDDDEEETNSVIDDLDDDDENYILPDRSRSNSNPKLESASKFLRKPNRLKRKRTYKPLVKSNKKRKKLKPIQTRIPVQVVTSNGEKLAAYYVQEQNPTNVEIQEGTIIPISNIVDGVRILCPEGCPKTFRNLYKLNMHVRTVHLGVTNPFDCSICGKNLGSLRYLRAHSKVHGEIPGWLQEPKQKVYTCDFEGCKIDQKFKSSSHLNIHIRTCHTNEKPFKCEACPECFVSESKRELHIEQYHPEIPSHKCSHCPKSFFREYRLREHTKTHTGERSFLCEICSKSFSQQSYLKYHQTKHEELQLQPYKCDECDKTFASPVNLKSHQRTQHEKQYRYRCEVCSHGVDHLSHLRLHMLTHSGDRPHVCEHCGKTFSRTSQLKIHMRNHTGERPYICQTCDKAFTNTSKLRRHELIHSDIKPHICQFCDKGFTQLTNLNSHISSIHRKNESLSTKNNDAKDEFMMEVVEHDGEPDDDNPPSQTLELQPQTVFQSQVFGLESSNFTNTITNIPIQFQVLTEGELEGVEGDGSYTEFIIVNQI